MCVSQMHEPDLSEGLSLYSQAPKGAGVPRIARTLLAGVCLPGTRWGLQLLACCRVELRERLRKPAEADRTSESVHTSE